MNDILRTLQCGHPVIRVASLEEDDALELTSRLGKSTLGAATRVWQWDAARGLSPALEPLSTLAQVLDAAANDPGPSLWLLQDVQSFLADPATVRRLRRLSPAIADRPVRVVLFTPPGELPSPLDREIPTATYALPSHETLLATVEAEFAARGATELPARLVASALLGLTRAEAQAALRRALAGGNLDGTTLTRLFEDKARRVEAQALEYFPPTIGMDEVGGLSGIKEWTRRRAPAFHKRTAGGPPPPRGVLLTGVSGCGKSYSVKAMATFFGVPLFRLDMTRIFGRPQPEAAFARALSAVEAMLPCMLWVDEIENAFALGTLDTGASSRIAGGLLTWLQERPEGILVAATANRIELLPAELLRRGRFDQIFFVDLPEEEDRKRIWAIHIGRRGLPVATFDLVVLSKATAAWSAAEIEAAVDAALVDASADGKPVTKEHFFRAIGTTIPLAVTMKEQIRKIKEWAHDRALAASGKAI